MNIEKIHHVAYRCRDAKETVEWYGSMLKMDFVLAIAGDKVPAFLHAHTGGGHGDHA